MNDSRWIEVTPSEYEWERQALRYLKTRLPDGEPFRAWSNRARFDNANEMRLAWFRRAA